jgi:hypothetical protein
MEGKRNLQRKIRFPKKAGNCDERQVHYFISPCNSQERRGQLIYSLYLGWFKASLN